MTKIVAYDSYLEIDDDSVEAIQRTAPDAEVVAPTKEGLATELTDAEIFYGYHSPEIFCGAEKLCWIQSAAAGLDAMVDAPLIARGLTITNASGVHAPQVAEAAWALTLAWTRSLPTYFRPGHVSYPRLTQTSLGSGAPHERQPSHRRNPQTRKS